MEGKLQEKFMVP